MTIDVCLFCIFKFTCNKSSIEIETCNHKLVVEKFLHNLSRDTSHTEDQGITLKGTDVLDELLAER